jgi:hypothetical protein
MKQKKGERQKHATISQDVNKLINWKKQLEKPVFV